MVDLSCIHLASLLPEPILLLSGDGQVVHANDAAAELTRRSRADLDHVHLTALVADPPDRVRSLLRLFSRSLQLVPGVLHWKRSAGVLDVRCDGAVLVPRSDAQPAVLLLRCRPKAEATDPFILLNRKIEELSREVLERRKIQRQRDELLDSERAARQEAERASRLKDEFLATLSHELRTPLNAILGWSHLLRKEAAGEVAEGLEIIERNARLQNQLVEDLLDLSRIISGKIRLDVQRVELAPVIQAAADAIRPAADGKQIRLQVTLDPLAGPVHGDPARLQQVVWNLLSNAVKFTPKTGRVQVLLERVNSHVEITVSDTGQGIAPEFLPHLFERFKQADSSSTRQHGGLGIGLSLVKQLVELHGGSVRAKSPGVGQGASFIVTLPLPVSHGADDADRIHPTSGGDPLPQEGLSLTGLSVLVVDDERDAVELVRRLLSDCGAEVLTARSSAEALDLVRRERPDVLLSDIGMPDRDGYELIRAVRALGPEQGGAVPALALTAFARSEDRTRALLAGYQMHIAKPVEPAELIACVASLAGRTGA